MPWKSAARRREITARYRKTDKYKQRMVEWREKNREKVARYSRESKSKIRAAIRAFKDVPCADCGGRFDSVCMDFDHRPGEKKLFTLGSENKSMPQVLTEIAKCDIVCSNCHRLRTHRRRDHGALIRERKRGPVVVKS